VCSIAGCGEAERPPHQTDPDDDQCCQIFQSIKCQIQDEKMPKIASLLSVPQKIQCQTLNKMENF